MEDIDRQLHEIYGDRKWLIAAGAAVGATRMVEDLHKMGASTLVVASTEGVGELPDTDVVYTRSSAQTIVEGIRAFFASVEDPAPEVLERVDEYDPDRTARVLAEPFATAQVMLARTTFGVRKPKWSRLEDKMLADELWADLGVPHAPFRIVPPMEAPEAASELTSALGTVWVADNSRGWHGGADFVRWIRDAKTAAEMAPWFLERADRVRVMPFLDGIPCSIHGWVTETGIATLWPVEILVLRPDAGTRFGYAGVSTTWKPDTGTTNEMRAVADVVGNGLLDRVGYVGPFGVDGILTKDGFRPTELNPRMSVGAGVQLMGAEVPLGLMMRAEVEGLLTVDHSWLMEMVESSRPTRLAFGMPLPTAPEGTMHVARDESGLVEADGEGGAIGEIVIGSAPNGKYMRGQFEPDSVPPGAAAGPLVAEAINLANGTWNLSLPHYTATQVT